ncbi:MAG: twin-arginine translocation pathway signal protein, partial [Candidatus Hydrogenedentes bacterium]|nr:twin-arginine translocation pathway signal protein [Candidatus Hydrogenedentota bacterium]
MNVIISRRGFLKSAAMFSSIGLAPAFLTRTAECAVTESSSIAGFKDGRILVVVQLGGGNDGLNTLAPWSDDAYYRARPGIGLKKERLIRINDDLAANDKLAGLMKLYDSGQVSIVQGVGYPNPDRSHFRSMEIWHTASDSDEFLAQGWIGRYFDNCCSGTAARPQAGVSLGNNRPQAFDGERGIGVAFTDPMNYGWRPGKATDTAEHFEQINVERTEKNGTLDFLRHTTSNAIMSSYEVKEAAQRAGLVKGQPAQRGGKDPLQTVASLIRGDLQTRIFYVSAGGFDTHANQLTSHDTLLLRFSE